MKPTGTAVKMAQPADIISRLRLDLDHTIFDLGCRERRITLQAQQVRGLNLAWALRESGQGIDGKRVVIVGAGAGGLTAALAFARQGAKVAVFEQSEVILPRFRGNSQRFLHPHAFDWPAESASLHDASLPLMNWKAGLAWEVVAQLERAWSVERSTVRQLTLHLQSAIDKVDLKARTVQIRSSNAKTVPFDFLILAVGVGTERRRYGTPTYWENDALAQPSLCGSMSLLVSGNGDGGLVDVLRASLTDFDHARMMRQFLGSSDAYALGEAVRLIENRARLNPTFDLDTAYADLDLTRIARLVQGENRTQRQVTLSVSGPKLYRPDTMALNRVLVECLRRQGLEVLRSRVASVESCGDRLKIGFVNGTAREFDAAVFRHGPASDLAAVFPEIAQTAPPIDPNSADNARHPHWPKGYFSSRIDSLPTQEEPTAYEVIELDSGFGLKSRAWSMNERGEVVGWTDLGTGRDHGFFVWGGTGLPPQRGNIPGIRNTAATDINDHGDYVVTTEGGSRQAWLVTCHVSTRCPQAEGMHECGCINNKPTTIPYGQHAR